MADSDSHRELEDAGRPGVPELSVFSLIAISDAATGSPIQDISDESPSHASSLIMDILANSEYAGPYFRKITSDASTFAEELIYEYNNNAVRYLKRARESRFNGLFVGCLRGLRQYALDNLLFCPGDESAFERREDLRQYHEILKEARVSFQNTFGYHRDRLRHDTAMHSTGNLNIGHALDHDGDSFAPPSYAESVGDLAGSGTGTTENHNSSPSRRPPPEDDLPETVGSYSATTENTVDSSPAEMQEEQSPSRSPAQNQNQNHGLSGYIPLLIVGWFIYFDIWGLVISGVSSLFRSWRST